MKHRGPTAAQSVLARVGGILLALLAVPVFLLVALVMFPLWGFYLIAAWIWLRWRRWRYGVRYYLVCSRRRGWRELLINNLAPVLPRAVELCWVDEDYGLWRAHAMLLVRRVGIHLPRPYLVEVLPMGLRVQVLHETLLPLKTSGRRDREVQRQIRQLLRSILGTDEPAVTEKWAD